MRGCCRSTCSQAPVDMLVSHWVELLPSTASSGVPVSHQPLEVTGRPRARSTAHASGLVTTADGLVASCGAGSGSCGAHPVPSRHSEVTRMKQPDSQRPRCVEVFMDSFM